MAKTFDIDGILCKNTDFIRDTENIVANVKTWLEKYDKS